MRKVSWKWMIITVTLSNIVWNFPVHANPSNKVCKDALTAYYKVASPVVTCRDAHPIGKATWCITERADTTPYVCVKGDGCYNLGIFCDIQTGAATRM
jgi:hypothetical protein